MVSEYLDSRPDPSAYDFLQHDFAARMDWTVEPFAGANHPPALVVNGARTSLLIGFMSVAIIGAIGVTLEHEDRASGIRFFGE